MAVNRVSNAKSFDILFCCFPAFMRSAFETFVSIHGNVFVTVCVCPVYFCEEFFTLSVHRTIVSSSRYRFRIHVTYTLSISLYSSHQFLFSCANACTEQYTSELSCLFIDRKKGRTRRNKKKNRTELVQRKALQCARPTLFLSSLSSTVLLLLCMAQGIETITRHRHIDLTRVVNYLLLNFHVYPPIRYFPLEHFSTVIDDRIYFTSLPFCFDFLLLFSFGVLPVHDHFSLFLLCIGC